MKEINIANKYKTALLIVVILFLIYLIPDHRLKNHNQNSRYDLTFSIVKYSSFNINHYHKNTQDKAFFKGNYYTDKAIGLSVIGIPIFYFLKSYFNIFDLNLPYNRACYIIRIFAVSLLAAISGGLFYLINFELSEGNDFISMFNTILLTLTSPFFPYALMFYGHVPATFICIVLLFIIIIHRKYNLEYKGYIFFILGFLMSFAVFIEYPVLIIISLLACNLLLSKAKKKLYLSLLLGAVPILIIQLLYNYVTTGFFTKLAYSDVYSGYFNKKMAHGFFGIGLPNIKNIIYMLFSSKRGLLYYCPVLILPFYSFIKEFTKDKIFYFCIFFLYFLVFSGYFAISGGWSYSIRHLIPALPFLIILNINWLKCNIRLKVILLFTGITLLFISLGHCLLAITTAPQIPDSISNPLLNFNYLLLKNNFTADFLIQNATGFSKAIIYILLLFIIVIFLLIKKIKLLRLNKGLNYIIIITSLLFTGLYFYIQFAQKFNSISVTDINNIINSIPHI